MDYQIVFRNRSMIVLLLFACIVHCAFSILNRDIILTPKQGLQLSGKRIYYDENTPTSANANLRNDQSVTLTMAAIAGARPWERTLKHVTYITLFTNAAGGGGIITGNFSKVKEYNDFLQSPYFPSPTPNDSRFGDIVTMAQGRLELMANGTYRFVEGNCDYECARESNMIAMWHVQKIRHRDVDRKFHYEMKFSVSPVTHTTTPSETVVRGGPNKRTIMENSYNKGQQYTVQTFIQKEDDYPLSFRKILRDNEEDFADRRNDAARNFRQVTNQPYNHVTPMPQSTFIRGVYRPPPAHMTQQVQHLHGKPHGPPAAPLSNHMSLNIGEYYNKGIYVPKSSPKIELFPNLLTMMFGKPPQHATPHSTFRPPTSHAVKFPRPEVYNTMPPLQHLHQHPDIYRGQEVYNAANALHYHGDYPKTPQYTHQTQDHFLPKVPQTALVAHHYHHHFFLPNVTESGENTSVGQSSEQQIQNPADLYKNIQLQDVTQQPHYGQVYEVPTFDEHHLPQQHQQLQQFSQKHLQQLHQPEEQQEQQEQLSQMPPAPQKFVFPTTQIEPQRVIHITPVPPLKKPHYQQQYYHQVSKVNQDHGRYPGSYVSYPSSTTQRESYKLPTPRNKPFVQSQPLDETTVRYSEPDPLYANFSDHEENDSSSDYGEQQEQDESLSNDNANEHQLEPPQNYKHHIEPEAESSGDISNDRTIEAQVQAPQSNANTIPPSPQKHLIEERSRKKQQTEQKTSQSTINISTEKTTDNTIETEASNTITLSATVKPKHISARPKRVRLKVTKLTVSTTEKPKAFSTKVTTDKPTTTQRSTRSTSTTTTARPHTTTTTTTATSTTTKKPQQQFVSSSTTESPLKSISRYRNSNKRFQTSTTTTEKPVLKWKPRRKETNAKALNLKQLIQETQSLGNKNKDSKFQSSTKDITRIALLPTIPTTEEPLDETTPISNGITTVGSTTLASLLVTSSTPSSMDVFEVLTQKSVSKSIKFATSGNGQEIPIIINESANEVKT